MFTDALLQTLPALASELLDRFRLIEDACSRAKCDHVSLGSSNADWLALTLLSGAMRPVAAERLTMELLKRGVLLNFMHLGTSESNVRESLLPCHAVAYGAPECAVPLFRSCIRLAKALDEALVTQEVVRKMQRLIDHTSPAHVAHFPPNAECSSVRKMHSFIVRPPEMKGGVYHADLSRVIVARRTGRLRVDMSHYAGATNKYACQLCLPVNVVQDGYILSYTVPILEVQLRTVPPPAAAVRVPSSVGDLPVLPWLDFCKLMSVQRRGKKAMAIVAVFVFFELWKPRDDRRLQLIRDDAHAHAHAHLKKIVASLGASPGDEQQMLDLGHKAFALVVDFLHASRKRPVDYVVSYLSPLSIK